jgi:2-polyprenyl-6-methoxyphenol hydroxylase-like FAD-dependent oxidoreductase
MKTQVLVVGAGPVGLTMAIELARYGVAVRIVDKAAQRTDKSKALVIWSRTLELMDRAGCTPALIAAGAPALGANIFAGGRPLARVTFEGIESAYAFALMIPQSETERVLETHLERLGVRVERSVEATGFTQGPDDVDITLRNDRGEAETLTVDWLVGCDGAHSMVRHGLNTTFEGDTVPADFLLADVHLAGQPTPPMELAIYWHAEGLIAIFPITPGRARVIADLGPSASPTPPTPTLEQIQAILDRRGPGGIAASDPVWLSGFRINERKVAHYSQGRVFVAGDAAHVHSPAGGQGMNTGMQDAINLAWKLALTCRGEAGPALLESYDPERGAVGEKVIADARRMMQVAMLRNPAAQAARNFAGHFLLGLPPVNEAMARNFSEITIGYPHSPLNGRDAPGIGGPAPGERLAPVKGQTPVGAGATPRFALFAVPSEPVNALLARRPDLLEPALRPPVTEMGMWLVRPDGYIACVAREGDAAAIERYLEGLAA